MKQTPLPQLFTSYFTGCVFDCSLVNFSSNPRLWVSWCWLPKTALCTQKKTRRNAGKQWASVCKSVWARVKKETAIVIMLLRSRDYVVAMGTTFFPSRKVEEQPGLVLLEENNWVSWNGSRASEIWYSRETIAVVWWQQSGGLNSVV